MDRLLGSGNLTGIVWLRSVEMKWCVCERSHQ